MPHFVTDIRHADSAQRAATPRAATLRAAASSRAAGARAYRRRLASLQTSAPDTLRARVRRALRLAPASSRTE
jgi:hypothetical protein